MKRRDTISCRLVSYTDAAGKYSADAVRCGNEDNFFVDCDLSGKANVIDTQDKVFRLGELGLLMVVADGMGGMNAGEVASQIAVDTVKNAFAVGKLSQDVTATYQSRQKYLERVIKLADKNIKTEARVNPQHEGMGSTVVIAWLYGSELSIGWCGDSRAYLYNDKHGIRLISQDHSYVQELVNKGLLTYNQTFDHPQNNIVTRSLGDPTKEASPESKTITVGKGDIVLLCSDGLSGVLRDRKTYDSTGNLLPDSNMEDIIRANTESLKSCRDALWTAAEQAGWYDNVTAILCQITEGPESPWNMSESDAPPFQKHRRKRLIYFMAVVALVFAVIGGFMTGHHYYTKDVSKRAVPDTVPIATSAAEVEKTGEVAAATPGKKTDSESKATIARPEEQKSGAAKQDSVLTEKTDGLTRIDRTGTDNNDRASKQHKYSPIEKKNTPDKGGKSINPLDDNPYKSKTPGINNINN